MLLSVWNVAIKWHIKQNSFCYWLLFNEWLNQLSVLIDNESQREIYSAPIQHQQDSNNEMTFNLKQQIIMIGIRVWTAAIIN